MENEYNINRQNINAKENKNFEEASKEKPIPNNEDRLRHRKKLIEEYKDLLRKLQSCVGQEKFDLLDIKAKKGQNYNSLYEKLSRRSFRGEFVKRLEGFLDKVPNTEAKDIIQLIIQKDQELVKIENEVIMDNKELVYSSAHSVDDPGKVFDILLMAVEAFKPELGNKFSTYVNRIIPSYLDRYTRKHDSIVYPEDVNRKIRNLERILSKYRDKDERPNLKQLAKELDVPIEQVRKTLLNMKAKNPLSLDETRLKNNEEYSLYNLISDNATDPAKLIEQKLFKEAIIQKIKATLTSMEREVFDYRFEAIMWHLLKGNAPLKGVGKPTLREVGKKLSLSWERVRQIENVITQKIKQQIKHGAFDDLS